MRFARKKKIKKHALNIYEAIFPPSRFYRTLTLRKKLPPPPSFPLCLAFERKFLNVFQVCSLKLKEQL